MYILYIQYFVHSNARNRVMIKEKYFRTLSSFCCFMNTILFVHDLCQLDKQSRIHEESSLVYGVRSPYLVGSNIKLAHVSYEEISE
jgi:hypothetical protein